jgi:bla regulator protein BlaR1
METLLYNIGQVLGISILHSLWQGLLIYAVIRLLLIAFPAISAAKKYNLLYTGLMVMAVWFAYTFFMEAKLYNWATNAPTYFSQSPDAKDYGNNEIKPTIQQVEQPFYYSYKQLIKTYLPYISVLYLLSVVINLVRLAMGWQSIRKIRKQATAAATWQPLTDKLAERAGILKQVQISFSNLIDVPCAFGYIKPILLLPLSISTQLSSEEIEVIILHELAHIKNNDYILNLIQQIVALLLFLNPFAQLISRMIDLERENRCDDTVLQMGDPLTYAAALVKLEKTRQSNVQLAMAATGKKYHLFARIQRIMNDQKPVVNVKHLIFGLLIFISSVGSIAWLNPEIKDGKLVSKRASKAITQLTAIIKSTVSEKDDNIPLKEEKAVSAKPDSVQANTKIVVDTTLTAAEIAALKDEYRQLRKQVEKDREALGNSPENKQVTAAQQALDSAFKSKMKPLVTPEMDKEWKYKLKAYTDYQNKYIAPRRKLLVKEMSDLTELHPDVVAFDTELKRKVDSVFSTMHEKLGLSKQEVYKTEQWHNWYQAQQFERSFVLAKIRVPSLRAAQDSINYLIYQLDQTPEYVALTKETFKRNEEIAKAQRIANVGLESYEEAVKQASSKMDENPKVKKLSADTKRLKEILDKLKGNL